MNRCGKYFDEYDVLLKCGFFYTFEIMKSKSKVVFLSFPEKVIKKVNCRFKKENEE
jgi:hypothetical protein